MRPLHVAFVLLALSLPAASAGAQPGDAELDAVRAVPAREWRMHDSTAREVVESWVAPGGGAPIVWFRVRFPAPRSVGGSPFDRRYTRYVEDCERGRTALTRLVWTLGRTVVLDSVVAHAPRAPAPGSFNDVMLREACASAPAARSRPGPDPALAAVLGAPASAWRAFFRADTLTVDAMAPPGGGEASYWTRARFSAPRRFGSVSFDVRLTRYVADCTAGRARQTRVVWLSGARVAGDTSLAFPAADTTAGTISAAMLRRACASRPTADGASGWSNPASRGGGPPRHVVRARRALRAEPVR